MARWFERDIARKPEFDAQLLQSSLITPDRTSGSNGHGMASSDLLDDRTEAAGSNPDRILSLMSLLRVNSGTSKQEDHAQAVFSVQPHGSGPVTPDEADCFAFAHTKSSPRKPSIRAHADGLEMAGAIDISFYLQSRQIGRVKPPSSRLCSYGQLTSHETK
jgi:hypothetical protein